MKNYYQLINELRNLAEKCLVKHPEPRKEKEAILLYAIAKAEKTLSAIILLCKNGMGEDATILSRTLFELSLTVEYILNDKSNYQAERYMSYDWIQRINSYEYIKTSTSAEVLNKPENIRIIKDVDKHAQEAQSKYKYNKFGWSDVSIHKMAEQFGKVGLYRTAYNIQCSLSHSNPRTMNDYFKIENDQLVLNSCSSDNLVEETLVITFSSYYELLAQFNEYFKKGVGEELKKLEGEFVKKINLNK
ncbi:MAG: DUF5677 domain-containing protein [Patescibacteria group bacterium]